MVSAFILVCETEEAFQIGKPPPTEAPVETPETPGRALRQMGQRAMLPGEAEGFPGHFDIERLGSRIRDDRGHPATTPMMAGDEM